MIIYNANEAKDLFIKICTRSVVLNFTTVHVRIFMHKSLWKEKTCQTKNKVIIMCATNLIHTQKPFFEGILIF